MPSLSFLYQCRLVMNILVYVLEVLMDQYRGNAMDYVCDRHRHGMAITVYSQEHICDPF